MMFRLSFMNFPSSSQKQLIKGRLKGLALATGLLTFILLVLGWIGQSVSVVSESAAKQALNLEGRRLLYQMQLRLKEHFDENGYYSAEVGDSPMRAAYFGAGFSSKNGEAGVWWGVDEFQDQIAYYCPDCGVSRDHFKLVAIGNIDQDAELDVWTFSSQDTEARQINSD